MVDSDIVGCDFELRLRNYIHLQINTHGNIMNSILPPAIGKIIPRLLFSKDGFGIK